MNSFRALVPFVLFVVGDSVVAEVVALEIADRTTVASGAPLGGRVYEKLTGTVHFAFDPENELNAAIVDVARAPRDDDGRVRVSADLMVLRPVAAEEASGTLFVEVSNRGGKACLGYFNRAQFATDPATAEHFGDALLMRRGLTIVWVGWQFDVPREPGRLRLNAPVATFAGAPIEGPVRCDWTVDEPTTALGLGHRDHVPYPIVDPDGPDHVLTWRTGRSSARCELERSAWRFTPDGERVVRVDGAAFEAGRIWELVYVARDPVVVGLGLAALRDIASYAKYDDACPFPAERAVAFGVSQTGRFLRHFLYQGFNTDEVGRSVYDGMLIHTAGAGRGSFNHRFGQPSRDAHRYSAFFYPTDLFPFTGATQTDPVTDEQDGLAAVLQERGHLPKVMTTNTGYEYWGRAAALVHVDPTGTQDVEPLPHERLYHLAGAQHFAAPWPPRADLRHGESAVWQGDPLDFLTTLRALLVALLDWVEEGTEPPPSAFPRLDAGTLVPLDELAWPEIPGLPAPTVAHAAYRVDYGPRWKDGVVSLEPPRIGRAFPVLVPQVDALGNELGGLRSLEARVPVATHAPWHVRPDGELTDFWGSYAPLPLARTVGDARTGLLELYADSASLDLPVDRYERAVRETASALVQARTLLDEDVERAVRRALEAWEHAHAIR